LSPATRLSLLADAGRAVLAGLANAAPLADSPWWMQLCWSLWAWTPGILHLGRGAFGVAPVAVRGVAAAWRDRAGRDRHRFNWVELAPLIAAARERAAGFLGIGAYRAGWGTQRVRGCAGGARLAGAAPRARSW
jgi:hypothetical protein